MVKIRILLEMVIGYPSLYTEKRGKARWRFYDSLALIPGERAAPGVAFPLFTLSGMAKRASAGN